MFSPHGESEFQTQKQSSPPPNTACSRLGVRAAFSGIFLALSYPRFGGESTLPPQAANASRWADFELHISILFGVEQ